MCFDHTAISSQGAIIIKKQKNPTNQPKNPQQLQKILPLFSCLVFSNVLFYILIQGFTEKKLNEGLVM